MTKNKYVLESEDGQSVYHVAVIDYLQEWNFEKKCERFLKLKLLHAPADGLSAIGPEEYQRRFWNFMRNQVFPGK